MSREITPRELCKQEALTLGVCSWGSCVFEGFAYEGHENVWNEKKTSTSLHWHLLIAGLALSKVRDARVQLRRGARSTFPFFVVVSTIGAVACRRPDRLTDEDPLSGHLF
jgi:hypothetical protein